MVDLKVLRAFLRLSQAELAREIGIDRRRISEIENGERSLLPPEVSRVQKLLARRVPGSARQLLLLAGLKDGDRSRL